MLKKLMIQVLCCAFFINILTSCGNIHSHDKSQRSVTPSNTLGVDIIGNYGGHFYSEDHQLLQNMQVDIISVSDHDTTTLDLHGALLFNENNQHIEGHYHAPSQQLHLEFQNSTHGIVLITAQKTIRGFSGTWISKTNGHHGLIEFSKEMKHENSTFDIQLQGFLQRDKHNSYHELTASIRNHQNDNDTFPTAMTLYIYSGPQAAHEVQRYQFEDIQVHALSGKISAQDTKKHIKFTGYYDQNIFQGDWHNSQEQGSFYLSTQDSFDHHLGQLSREPQISGTYYTKLPEESSFPENISLHIFSSSEGPDSSLMAHFRFYIGSVGSHEYIESPATPVNFHPLTRHLNATIQEPYNITLTGTFGQSVWSAEIIDHRWSSMESVLFTKQPSTESQWDLHGSYTGWVQWEDSYDQKVSLQIETIQNEKGPFQIKGTMRAFLNDQGSEYLSYQFPYMIRHHETGIFTAQSSDGLAQLQLEFYQGTLNGAWISKDGSISGHLTTSQISNDDLSMMPSCPIAGRYMGKIQKPSAHIEDQDCEITLTTQQNSKEPHGFKIDGSLHIGQHKFSLKNLIYDVYTNQITGHLIEWDSFIQGHLEQGHLKFDLISSNPQNIIGSFQGQHYSL